MVLISPPQGTGPSADQIKQIIKDADKSEAILEIVKDLQNKLDSQQKMVSKLVAMLSRMYQDNEINKDTFNKLDEFLKPYYDTSNLAEDY